MSKSQIHLMTVRVDAGDMALDLLPAPAYIFVQDCYYYVVKSYTFELLDNHYSSEYTSLGV